MIPRAVQESAVMKRRDFLGAFAAGAFSVRHRVAFSEEPAKARRVGIIGSGPLWVYFRERLRDRGDIEGKNITREPRTADGNPDRLRAAARELPQRRVDVTAVAGSPAEKAAKKTPETVPVG